MVYKRFTLFAFLISRAFQKGAPFIRLKFQYIIAFPYRKRTKIKN